LKLRAVTSEAGKPVADPAEDGCEILHVDETLEIMWMGGRC